MLKKTTRLLVLLETSPSRFSFSIIILNRLKSKKAFGKIPKASVILLNSGYYNINRNITKLLTRNRRIS